MPRFLALLHSRLDGPVTVIWDNYSSHISRHVKQYAQQWDWLTIIQMPSPRRQPDTGLITKGGAVKDWEDDEYCLYVNSGEAADLWAVLADWTKSEDEEEWNKHIPRFARLIGCWQALGFIKVFQSDEWPAHEAGQEVTGEALTTLLADPRSWQYAEEPAEWTCVVTGNRPIIELTEGMCDEDR